MPSLVLLHIIAGVCLLLFGLRLVRTGVTRGYGVQLRRFIGLSTKNRFLAFLSGIGVTSLLQSSTATTMIIASFAGQGLITTTAALAVILGADVGTTLVAQILTFDLSWLSPILIITGYIFYAGKDQSSPLRQMGRIFIGVGLMILSLTLIKQAAAPLKESDILPLILNPLDQDPLLAILLAAVLTWIFHSSLAIILLLMSMAQADVIPLHLGLLMVLGANIGGVIGPLFAALKDPPEAARIPSGNLLMRVIGVLLVLAFVDNIKPFLAQINDDPARMIVNFHMGFNLALALVFLPILPMVTKIVTKIVPDKKDEDDPAKPQYIDERSLDTPTIALTNASREALRIADYIDQMFQVSWDAFRKNDRTLIDRAHALDKVIDQLYKLLKSYLVRLGSETMTKVEARRHFEILTFATNLEHVGDIIDKNLLSLAKKRIDGGLSFSAQGMIELNNLAQLVMDSIRLAQTVFISSDPKLARQLVEDKNSIKQAEKQASMNHMSRLQQGIPETLATSDLHMDIIRDLRRINSLMSAIAYPILEEAGELHKTILKKDQKNNDLYEPIEP
jgi:phosphate:Na+ symporter